MRLVPCTHAVGVPATALTTDSSGKDTGNNVASCLRWQLQNEDLMKERCFGRHGCGMAPLTLTQRLYARAVTVWMPDG